MKRFAVTLMLGAMATMFAPAPAHASCNGIEIVFICPWGGGGSVCISHDPPTGGQNCTRPD
ncbi:MAG: hypothetical protein M3134_06035 [Actinomycetota bacterium]|nr:hypothetical protein [Actinomycetota bacterium]